MIKANFINFKSSSTTLAIAVGAVALLWAASGLRQPLWVDELHTSWVVADGWNELLVRAKQGNQTPTYFVVLNCLTWIFDQPPDWLLRLPSVLAWGAAVASMTWMLLRLREDRLGWMSNAAVIVWCLCVFLDAWQFFYAIEARVYGIVQLLNLWAWFTVLKLAGNKTVRGNWWALWTVLACGLLHLHITSGLVVVFQGAALAVITVLTNRDRVYFLTSQLLVGANAAWLLYVTQSVWQRRQQWASFAGDGSLVSLAEMFPIFPILLPVLAGWLIVSEIKWNRSQRSNSKSETQSNEPVTQPAAWLPVVIWGTAAFAPLLSAWLLTRYNIAPIFHYRFVIGFALPMYLFAGSLMLLQQSPALRCTTALLAFAWLNYSHGPLSPEQQGRWQNERQEDWRSATEFIEQHFQTQTSHSLWCYAGLIEGLGLEQPLTAAMDEYLSYPLRGSYRLSVDNVPIVPHGLVANRQLWLRQISQFGSSQKSALRASDLEQARPDQPADVWIIYRGLQEPLSADLQLAGMHQFVQPIPIRQFGRVSVVCIQIDFSRLPLNP